MNRFKTVSRKLQKNQTMQLVLYLVVFGAIGGLVIIFSHAASNSNAIEPETGSISGNATLGSDTTASGGKYVSFKAVTTGINVVTGGTDSSCIFQKADKPMHVAFCDGFNSPNTNDANVNRSGDLFNLVWGVSRNNTAVNGGQGQFADYYGAHLTGCGSTQYVMPTKDIQICNGRIQEAVFDGGDPSSVFGTAAEPTNGLTTLAMYPKQPFDISGGRTGTVAFDVSADSEGPHAAWPEFWWTDQPVPVPGDARSAWRATPRNAFGFAISKSCPAGGYTGIDHMVVTRNYVETNLDFTNPVPWNPTSQGCIKSGSSTGKLNHVEVRINQNHIEVWMSPGDSDVLQEVAVADNANITMTKGVLWMEDVHYNGCKFNTQCDHDFAWDNFGFDGPGTYRDLAFDVPDANINKNATTIQLGYRVNTSLTLQVPGVYHLQTPTAALVTFSWFPTIKSVPSISINGNPIHDTVWPFDDNTYAWRTIAIPVPITETNDGTNNIVFKTTEDSVVSNVDLILVAGSPVPSQLQ